jgi:molybdate transport system permease protein
VNRPRSDWPFLAALGLLGGFYAILILGLLVSDVAFTQPEHLARAWSDPNLRSAVWLSLASSSASAILSVWVAVPLGYLLTRTRFPGRAVVEFLTQVPIVLPPVVVGLSLVILFQSASGRALQTWLPITYAVPAVVLAQFTVAAAYATRSICATLEQLSPRTEQLARSLGASRSQAFWRVVLPEARQGILAAGLLAWARSLGEFGPVLVFAGVARGRTEVMPTSVFLELNVGNVEAAVAVALAMVFLAGVVLVTVQSASRKMPH